MAQIVKSVKSQFNPWCLVCHSSVSKNPRSITIYPQLQQRPNMVLLFFVTSPRHQIQLVNSCAAPWTLPIISIKMDLNCRVLRCHRTSNLADHIELLIFLAIIVSFLMQWLGNFIQNQFCTFKLLLFCDPTTVFYIAWIRTNRVSLWNLLLLHP